jgi:hypothetical protein
MHAPEAVRGEFREEGVFERKTGSGGWTPAAVGDTQAKQGPCIVSHTAGPGWAAVNDPRIPGALAKCSANQMKWNGCER